MVELADIFRRAGPAYCKAFAGRMLPSHLRTMQDIVRCRTPALGGSLFRCSDCAALDYAYHSCRNRHCPKCHHDQTRRWLEKLRSRLLPCAYYLLTFTLPAELRRLTRSHQRLAYSILLREAAAAVQQLANDRKWVGARLGILAVLHTWSRTLTFHPHAHLLVTAGGLSSDGSAWIKPAHSHFLLPGFALSKIFRAKVHNAFHLAGLDHDLDPLLWRQPWTVHLQHAGDGDHATAYLSRYVHRVALTNQRIERFDNGRVTFSYIHSRSHQTRRLTLPVDTFIARFLQHVLPRGFTKIRYYGLLSPACHLLLERARHLLEAAAQPLNAPSLDPDRTDLNPSPGSQNPQHETRDPSTTTPRSFRHCPVCKRGRLVLVDPTFTNARRKAPP